MIVASTNGGPPRIPRIGRADRELPRDDDAELTVVGCLIAFGDEVAVLAGNLSGADFFCRPLGHAWDAAIACARDGSPRDAAAVVEELKRTDNLEQCKALAGGRGVHAAHTWLLELACSERVLVPQQAIAAAQAIRSARAKRIALERMQDAEADLYAARSDASEVIAAAAEALRQIDVDRPARRLLPTLSLSEIPDPGPVEWLVKSLWTDAAFGIVGALPKSWKSYFSLYLSICISTGRKVFDRFEVRQGKVLVFNAEGGKRSVRRRVGALCRALNVPLAELQVEVIDVLSLRLDDDDQAQLFLATIEAKRPVLVIVDPLREVHGGDENDSAYIAKLLAPFRALQERIACAFMFIHHSVKPGAETSKRRPAERLRGSGALAGAIDSGLFLEVKGEGDDKRVEVSALHRDAPEPDPFTIALRHHHTPDGDATWFELVEKEQDEAEETERAVAARDKARKKILKAIELAAMPGRQPLRTKKQLEAICKMRAKTVREVVDELLEESLIEHSDLGGFRPRGPREKA